MFEVISEAHIGNILHLVINHILVGKQVLQVAHSIRDTTFLRNNFALIKSGVSAAMQSHDFTAEVVFN